MNKVKRVDMLYGGVVIHVDQKQPEDKPWAPWWAWLVLCPGAFGLGWGCAWLLQQWGIYYP